MRPRADAQPGAGDLSGHDSLARYRPWFYAAALYNLVWGVVAIFFPARFFGLIGMPEPN